MRASMVAQIRHRLSLYKPLSLPAGRNGVAMHARPRVAAVTCGRDRGLVLWRGAALPWERRKAPDGVDEKNRRRALRPDNGQDEHRCGWRGERARMCNRLAERTVCGGVLRRCLVRRGLGECLDDGGLCRAVDRPMDMGLRDEGLQREGDQQQPGDKAKTRSPDPT